MAACESPQVLRARRCEVEDLDFVSTWNRVITLKLELIMIRRKSELSMMQKKWFIKSQIENIDVINHENFNIKWLTFSRFKKKILEINSKSLSEGTYTFTISTNAIRSKVSEFSKAKRAIGHETIGDTSDVKNEKKKKKNEFATRRYITERSRSTSRSRRLAVHERQANRETNIPHVQCSHLYNNWHFRVHISVKKIKKNNRVRESGLACGRPAVRVRRARDV